MERFRIDAGDTVKPYFVSDAELCSYLNEAEREAAIRARLINDVEEIAVSAGVQGCDIPETLFAIRHAELRDAQGTFYPISSTSRDVLDAVKPGWRRLTERPEWLVHDDKDILLGSIPDAAYTLFLDFLRTPRRLMALEEDAPEIHSTHHDGLVNWALFRAFSKPDADFFDPSRSAVAEAAFVRQFGKHPGADLRRRQNANRPHRNRLHA